MVLLFSYHSVLFVDSLLVLFGCPYIIIMKCNSKDSEYMEYISAPEAAKKWGISERRVQKLCEENHILAVCV